MEISGKMAIGKKKYPEGRILGKGNMWDEGKERMTRKYHQAKYVKAMSFIIKAEKKIIKEYYQNMELIILH